MNKYEDPMITITEFDRENVVTGSSVDYPDNTALGNAMSHYTSQKAFIYSLDYLDIAF